MSRLLAALLAAVFAWAAFAKLRDRPGTTRAFAGAALPAPARLAVAVPAGEIVLAGLLLVAPAWGATAALAVLAGFSVHLALARRRGVDVGCGCFGAARPVPAGRELVRNAGLALIALIVVVAG